MTKTKYKALLRFQGHDPGDEFEAELDPDLERRAKERGQITTVNTKKKTEKETESE